MKKPGLFFICALLCIFILAGPAFAKDRVVVYTSLENEEVVEYLKVAKQELSDLDIQAIRLSTGELGARMLAERDNPQADCIWGWAVTNTSEFIPKGMLKKYKPKGWKIIPANFKDPKGYWTAIDLYAAAFVGNERVLGKDNLPMAKGWKELLNPAYKGKLIMPNPASSGTGFLQVASLLVMMDPDYKKKPIEKNKAWDFLKELDKNMGQYIKSGSKPARSSVVKLKRATFKVSSAACAAFSYCWTKFGSRRRKKSFSRRRMFRAPISTSRSSSRTAMCG